MATAALLPIADMDEQAAQPRIEAIDVAERRQLSPGEDERLLDGVLR